MAKHRKDGEPQAGPGPQSKGKPQKVQVTVKAPSGRWMWASTAALFKRKKSK